MSKHTFFGLTGLAAFALIALAPAAPDAMAETPKCKNRINEYVACTNKRKDNAPRRNAKEHKGEIELLSHGHGRKSKGSRSAR